MSDWSDVRAGDVVRGKDGKPWEVTSTLTGEVTLRRLDDGKAFSGKPTGEVEIIERAAPEIDGVDALDLATATAQIRLGGEVVAHNDGAGYRVPLLDRRDVAGMHSHMFLLHGFWTEDMKGRGTTQKLVDGHEAGHGPDAVHGHAYVLHWHDKDWP